MIHGKVTFKSSTATETYETGDADYAPPGHTPILFDGTEIVEFSPTEEIGHVRRRDPQHGGRLSRVVIRAVARSPEGARQAPRGSAGLPRAAGPRG